MPIDAPTPEDLYALAEGEIRRIAPTLTDFRPGSNLDALAGTGAILASETIAMALRVYRDSFVTIATDEGVLRIAEGRYGIARLPATRAAGYVRVEPSVGALVVRTTDTFTITAPGGEAVVFRPLEDVVNPAPGSAVDVEAVVEGPRGNIAAGRPVAANVADDPALTATLEVATQGGSNVESIDHLRRRLYLIPRGSGGATVSAVRLAALSARNRRVEHATAAVTQTSMGSILQVCVSDRAGGGNQALVDAALAALEPIVAAGAWLEVVPAVRQEEPLDVLVEIDPGRAKRTVLLDPEAVRAAVEAAVLDAANAGGPNEPWVGSAVAAAVHNAVPLARSVRVTRNGAALGTLFPATNATLRLTSAGLSVAVLA